MNEATDSPSGLSSAREADLASGRRLEIISVGWTLAEAAVAVVAGITAGSIALIGFGADSVIEGLSSFVLLWRLRAHADEERRERLALRLVGVSFLILAAYILFEAVHSLIMRETPSASYLGIALSVASIVIMPVLSRAKRRVAGRLRSAALVADSRQTDLCAYMSAILLGGLILNAILGWWWADPAAALIMVVIISRESMNALRGKGCDDGP